MLSIYRRHTKACTAKRPQHDRAFWKCKCVIYAEGSIGGAYIRQSLKTRSREQANRRILEAEARGSWDAKPALTRSRTITDAIAAFLEDAASAKGRELAGATLSKYRTLLGRLEQFCQEHSLSALDSLTTEHLRWFKGTWSTGPRATGNNISRLRAFFRFCIDNEWLLRNPALPLRGPKHVRDKQKLPFASEEMAAILAAAEKIAIEDECADLVALILLMRHTGLRISDATFLKADRVFNGQLQLYTQKTGSWVSIPLVPELLDRLRAVQPKTAGYLFISGSTRLETVTALWRRKIQRVFKLAGIAGGHCHRFRHTFAVDLLSKGVDIKTVSLLLGHSSVTITEKFYAAWITSRQQALSEQLKRTWSEDLAA
jgi:integrase/recombinase XerC